MSLQADPQPEQRKDKSLFSDENFDILNVSDQSRKVIKEKLYETLSVFKLFNVSSEFLANPEIKIVINEPPAKNVIESQIDVFICLKSGQLFKALSEASSGLFRNLAFNLHIDPNNIDPINLALITKSEVHLFEAPVLSSTIWENISNSNFPSISNKVFYTRQWKDVSELDCQYNISQNWTFKLAGYDERVRDALLKAGYSMEGILYDAEFINPLANGFEQEILLKKGSVIFNITNEYRSSSVSQPSTRIPFNLWNSTDNTLDAIFSNNNDEVAYMLPKPLLYAITKYGLFTQDLRPWFLDKSQVEMYKFGDIWYPIPKLIFKELKEIYNFSN